MLIDTRTIGPFTVKTYALPEDVSPKGMFSDDEIEFILSGIESGNLLWFCAKVTAEFEDIELASEYLGGCCYTSCADFVESDGYHGDMVREAVSQAEKRLREIADKAREALKLAA